MLYSTEYLHSIRRAELEIVLDRHGALFAGADILEIGSGTGLQLQMLRAIGRSAEGVEIAGGPRGNRVVDGIRDYDGIHLPFADRSFDLVFSSNVIEHVTHEAELHADLRRVLRPGGRALHLVPSAAWRILTSGTHYPALACMVLGGGGPGAAGASDAATPPRRRGPWRLLAGALVSPRHGERGNRFTEAWHFSKPAWRRRFSQLGWTVESIEPTGLLYSGYGLFAGRLPLDFRLRLGALAGSACWICLMHPRSES
jgi:SAM-dependent methyltransferase